MNTIGFWNVHGAVNPELTGAFCAEHNLDLLLLAELGEISPYKFAREIGLHGNRFFTYANPNAFRIKIFSSLPHSDVVPLLDHQYFSVVKVSPPLGPEYLLVGVHLPSKMEQRGSDQAIVAQRIAKSIREIERAENIEKTLVIGDFNMSPFESGLINSDSFHAVMDRNLAGKEGRTVLAEWHPFFYNPMWGLQGDTSEGAPGTFYARRSSPICFFWNMFDQALFRPQFIPYLQAVPVKIVDQIAETMLLKKGLPDSRISDHLPIKVFFKSENEVCDG